MEALLVAVAFVLGALAGAAVAAKLLARQARKALEGSPELRLKERELELLKEAHSREVLSLLEERNRGEQSLKEAHDSQVRSLAQSHAEEVRNLNSEHEKQLEAFKEQAGKELATLKAEHERQMTLRKEQFEEQLKTATGRIENIGKIVLEQANEKLKKSNSELMGTLTQPLRETIATMQKALSENTKTSASQAASFKEQIAQMLESNREIGARTEALTSVLRHDNKAAGSMGEIILEELLSSQGLKRGVHYEIQANLKNDETDQALRPDVILHYPQNQDAIIDSKVSIVAYQKYVNAATEEERAQFLAEHIQSLRSHVKELARKDYSKFVRPPRKTIDFVIMFVPFESSLQLALSNEPSLWREAFESKVFITGEQNLLGILHIIHLAWVQNDQAENQEKVFRVAEQLLDRLGEFIKRYEELGEALSKAAKAYEKTSSKLMTGTQSVVKKGRELVDLGARENPNRRIPEPEATLLELE